jgi:dihydroxy-acid dehydratase
MPDDDKPAVAEGRIQPDDVLVIHYEGPKGGPGMREMPGVTSAMMGARNGQARVPPAPQRSR